MTRTITSSFQNALVGIDGATRHLDRIPYIAAASLSMAIGIPLSLFYQVLCYSKREKQLRLHVRSFNNQTILFKSIKPN